MKKYKLILFVVALLIASSTNTNAQPFRKVTKISKSFPVAASATVDISNKYGTIYVDTWDVDSIKVDIDFVISEKSEARFKKIVNSVEFDFSGTNYYRTIRTIFSGSYSSFFKDLKEATNLFTSSEDQTHVDYYITIPSHLNLKMEQKYGNIILPNLQGDLQIKLSNGDLQARNLEGNNQLDLSFGNAKIKHFEQGTLATNFMKVNLTSAGHLSLEARSSDVEINKANLIKLNTRRGSLVCQDIDFLYGEAEFTDISIDNLNKEVNAKLAYSVLRDLNMNSSYTKVKINSKRADIKLSLPETKAFNCQITHQKATLYTPKNMVWQPEKSLDEELTFEKKGYYKQNTASPSVIINIVGAELQITTH